VVKPSVIRSSKKATQQIQRFDPIRVRFVLLQEYRPPGGVQFYEYRNGSCVDGQPDYRRLNLYLSKDHDFVTIWFGLLDKVFVESLFDDHGLEPVEYNEPLFRGHIESAEQGRQLLKALRPESVLPQILTVDPDKGIVCELIKRDGG
jgi:hypothetical protein